MNREARARTRAEKAKLAAERKAADARREAIGMVLSDATRWRILLELARGEKLPVGELALLRRERLVERVFPPATPSRPPCCQHPARRCSISVPAL